MAASDAPYRNQYTLDIVFGVSSILMLVSLIWMFVQDYNREFKTEQRPFRDVEAAIAQRAALANIPSEAEIKAAAAALAKAKEARDQASSDVAKLRSQVAAKLPEKEKKEAEFQGIKSLVESRMSFYDLEKEKNPGSPLAEKYWNEAKQYEVELAKVQAERDQLVNDVRDLRSQIGAKDKDLVDKVSALKKINDRFDAQVNLAINKQWTMADTIRTIPVLDAFASPIKIHQFTNNDIPIDYNFKYVTRFDRCMSCHQGIDRPAYTKEALSSLRELVGTPVERVTEARKILEERKRALAGLPEAGQVPDPDKLKITTIPKSVLTDARINEYAVHPRLNLFVGANSKHPAERFGCSSCHSGQGSATSFTLASHTPNDPEQKDVWVKQHGWEHIHMWDFPMLPQRFVESSCLKCHYQVTDLYGSDGRNEAPKLLHGYNLIRENGCFGCHEIQGRKGGRDIGPDLRLEPSPPLEDLTPMERAKAESDPDNPPGRFRKVGPSLLRVSEKTHADWIARWLRSPRSFRPDTKMPHFYGLANNDPSVLPEDQKKFPDAEIWAVSSYLLNSSKEYLAEAAKMQKVGAADQRKDQDRLALLQIQGKLSEDEKKEVDSLERRIRLRQVPTLVDPAPNFAGDPDHGRQLFTERGCLACHSHQATAKDERGIVRKDYVSTFIPGVLSEAQFGPNLSQVADKFLTRASQDKLAAARAARAEPAKALVAATQKRDQAQQALDDAKTEADKAKKELDDAKEAEKTKLKDASDKATAKVMETKTALDKAKEDYKKPLADYQVSEKPFIDLLKQKDVNSARIWLNQWVLDPHVHSPRSRMPVTHLTNEEAADIAAWLLSQPATDVGPDWNALAVPQPETSTLKDLASVYLTRMLSKSDMNKLLGITQAPEKLPDGIIKDMPKDEQDLANNFSDTSLLRYVGKKAVGRLGCYACHDVPGFENAKPIGVGLNDWGKKPADRLAFEDIANYLKENYHFVNHLTDENGKPNAHPEHGKKPYDAFFGELLMHGHRSREGYLHQKIVEPRSYDYNRKRTWDDRARMPQFKFARIHRLPGESDQDFEARGYKEEADGREAVMTFILGLTAEQVPLKSVNLPTGDRLAEVKGRQVIDNFNCAGCHLIRPGVYDFKVTKDSLKAMTLKAGSPPSDHVFLNHHNWTGTMPIVPDVESAQGLIRKKIPSPDDDEEENPAKLKQSILLLHALRFTGPDKKPLDIPSFSSLPIAANDMLAPAPDVVRNKEELARYVAERGQLGGAFSDLITVYANKKNPKDFSRGSDGDSARARLLGPPSLVGQGERTQPEWLFQFLLNPSPVRKMTVLRMPRFNMSKTDARALVDYFGGVERITNPGVGLTVPYEAIHQQDPANDSFWRLKTQEYVARLKTTPAPDAKGKTVYDKKVAELQPIWQQIQKDYEAQKTEAQGKMKGWEERAKASRQRRDEAKAKFDAAARSAADEKDEAKKKKLDETAAALKSELEPIQKTADADTKQEETWKKQVDDLTDLVGSSTVDKQKAAWEQNDAYIADAYRLVVNRTLCLQCHTIGYVETKNDIMGPPLTITHQRLRPGWLERWIANPQRFLPYETSMPMNFPADKPGQFEEFFVGTPIERVQAARDLLMILPRAQAMPLNRYWVLPPAGDAKQ